MAVSTTSESAMSDLGAGVALGRFGLGPRPGEWRTIAKDPRQFVLAQCDAAPAGLFPAANLPSAVEVLETLGAARVELRTARKLGLIQPNGRPLPDKSAPPADKPMADMAAPDMAAGASPADAAAKAPPAGAQLAPVASAPQRIALNALKTGIEYRYNTAVASDHPFIERLVLFWSNHFCVSVRRSAEIRCGAGAYEREAIRPHVLGRFRDMLGAVASHPTMLGYLDNDVSIGPNSPMGIARKRGLNENFARELLELHTLGVHGGYTQADVTSLAKVLTGWTSRNSQGNGAGAFRFDAERHEPGSPTILGRVYAQAGMDQGLAVLDDIARHPATARHIAAKLVRHFVGDTAPDTIAASVADAFTRSDGDLAATARALVKHPDAWAAPPLKILPPYDMVVAVSRALGETMSLNSVILHCRKLGQPLWEPRAPAGYDDGDSSWAAPEGISTRLDLAISYAAAADKAGTDILAYANDLYGPGLSADTLTTLRRAESRGQALAMLIMSPELLKR